MSTACCALFLIALTGAGSLTAQSPAQQPVTLAEASGPAADWNISVVLREIAAQSTRLGTTLDEIHPERWEGAPETYAQQFESARVQAKALASEATALAGHPEQLSEALKVYFRMQSLQLLTGSLVEVLRKYQNPSLAQLVASMIAEGSVNRDRFQKYMVDLAAAREKEFAVMDHEAQRCRGILAGQPSSPATRKPGGK
jgi:hypothetical protein